MDRQTQIQKYRRFLSTSEYRRECRHLKAIKLASENNISVNLAAEVVKLDSRSLERAAKAVFENREIGQNGRPCLFNSEENQMLISYLKSLPGDLRLTYHELRNHVRIYFMSKLIYFIITRCKYIGNL